MKTLFYLNGALIEPPANQKELSIQLNFDKDAPTAQVSINKWRFVRDNAGTIQDYIDGGLLGSDTIYGSYGTTAGIFEGLPFRIDLDYMGTVQTIFDGYLDLTDNVEVSCNDITASAKESHKIDWLNESADSIDFQYLYDTNPSLFSGKFIDIPYVINTLPQAGEAFMATISAFVIAQELAKVAIELSMIFADIASVMGSIQGILKLVAYIVYFITLVASLIKLVYDAFNYIIQPIKYHQAMRVKDLLEVGCSHFGYTFQSSIFSGDLKDLVILPEKYQNPDTDGILGFLNPNQPDMRGYYKGTFGQLLRDLKLIFNAKIIIDNGKLIFERRDYDLYPATTYQLPDLRNDWNGFNTSEFNSGFYIKFQTDINDKNTIDSYTGTAYQITFQPNIIGNKNNLLFKGYETLNIPFALGKRKTYLTFPEQVFQVIFDTFSAVVNIYVTIINAAIDGLNAVIGVINDLIDALAVIGILIPFSVGAINHIQPVVLGSLMTDRIGMLMLENDFVDTPKMFIINEGAIPRKTDVVETLTAKYLWENYKYIDSFMPISGKHNQYILKNHDNVPFCFDDYEKVKLDNRILTNFGESALVDSLEWDVYNQSAKVKYRVNKLYYNNFKAAITNEATGN
jgi:hypothetical protein